MASIQVQDSGGKTKAVDSEIPLVPFIDLLLCCIMFLLVTAVWNQLAQIHTAQRGPDPNPVVTDTTPPNELSLQVSAQGYVLSSPSGDRLEIPRAGDRYDVVALRERLDVYHRVDPTLVSARVSSDDGVAYADVITAMDVLVGSGYPGVTVDGAM